MAQKKEYSIQNCDVLDTALSKSDMGLVRELDALYVKTASLFPRYTAEVGGGATSKAMPGGAGDSKAAAEIIANYGTMGKKMQAFLTREPCITVYPFVTPRPNHREASRVVSKLRDRRTQHAEFVYYTQRAYEMLFNLIYHAPEKSRRTYSFLPTPIDAPCQSFAVHKIPDIGDSLSNTVMCVMLRGALLPSMIISKEIEEYSPHRYVTPFLLFDIKRHRMERNPRQLAYRLDLSRSYVDLSAIEGKDLIFADPMNATTGSFSTIVKYIQEQGVRPRSIIFMNIISSFLGALRVVRNIDNVHCYVLWMDPTLDGRGYITPGLGDAGDRLNRVDPPGIKRDIVELIAGYGSAITNLYRSQIRAIETAVLR